MLGFETGAEVDEFMKRAEILDYTVKIFDAMRKPASTLKRQE